MTTANALRYARSADGARMQYEVLGEGAPVLFLHGSLAGRDTFARQHVLAQHFRLILPDLRGHNGADASRRATASTPP